MGAAAAVPIAALAFYFAPKRCVKPMLAEAFSLAPTTSCRCVACGAVIFGVGWGLAGICPAPVVALAVVGYLKIFGGFLPALALGMWLKNVMSTNDSKSTDPVVKKQVSTESTNLSPC